MICWGANYLCWMLVGYAVLSKAMAILLATMAVTGAGFSCGRFSAISEVARHHRCVGGRWEVCRALAFFVFVNRASAMMASHIFRGPGALPQRWARKRGLG